MKDKTVEIVLNLDSITAKKIENTAKELGISESEVLEMALENYYYTQKK